MVKEIHFISIVKFVKALAYCVNFEKKATASAERKNIYCNEETCDDIIKFVGERYIKVSNYNNKN